MMASGPVGGESEVLALLNVISDPKKAQERLKLLSDRSEEVGKREQTFSQKTVETEARIKAAQDKADADQATAKAKLTEVFDLLSSNQAKAKENAALAEQLNLLAESLAAKETSLADSEKAQRESFDAREKDLLAREAGIDQATKKAEADANAAAKLKASLEAKLAKLREIAS